MKILLIKPRGFCAGVVRAIETVERALQLFGPPIYVRHQIVHNRHVVEDLEKKGAIFVEDLRLIPRGSHIIYSAHGVAPDVRLEAKAAGLIEIDATCGLVTKVHSAVKRFADKGYQIILIGHKDHVEVIGTYGEAPHCTTVVESIADVNMLPFSSQEKLFYITQTTLSLSDVQAIVQALEKRYPQIETLPSSSLCYATTNRQMALAQIAEDCDLILVIGDAQSSNSNRLKELALAKHTQAYLINDANEIDRSWLEGVSTLGITAGASTPEPIVQRCLSYLTSLYSCNIQEMIHTQEDVFFQLPKQILKMYE